MSERNNTQEYRDDLAEKIKSEPDKHRRWEILEAAKSTDEYIDAFLEHSNRDINLPEINATAEITESEAEKYFPDIFRALREEYSDYISRLDAVRFQAKDSLENTAQYEIVEHLITLRSDIATEARGAETFEKWAKVLWKVTHEMTHAISYRKVEHDKTNETFLIESGLSHLDEKDEERKNKGINEVITNYFTFKAMPKIATTQADKKEFLKYRDAQGEWIIMSNISKIIGEQAIVDAYFKGNIDGFRRALNKGGISADILFQAAADDEPTPVLELIAKAQARKKYKKNKK